MTPEFVGNYIDQKLSENTNFIRFTFYELRVKCNLTEDETQQFLEWSKIKLENWEYEVYFTGAKFTYKEANRTVQPNELMIAIKT